MYNCLFIYFQCWTLSIAIGYRIFSLLYFLLPASPIFLGLCSLGSTSVSVDLPFLSYRVSFHFFSLLGNVSLWVDSPLLPISSAMRGVFLCWLGELRLLWMFLYKLLWGYVFTFLCIYLRNGIKKWLDLHHW